MNVLSVFDGISCGQVALTQLHIQYSNYIASEIYDKAIQITQTNFPKTRQIGDVRFIDTSKLPKIDLLIGGSPCQDLSIAKTDRKGLQGKQSSLFWEFIKIKSDINPHYFLLENVKNKWIQQMSTALNVTPIEINSDKFVQQNRPRMYWTNIPILNKLPQRPQWNGQYWQWRRTYWRENKNGVCPCLTANMGTGGNNVPYIGNENNKRRLTPEECEELQGLPKGYTQGVANSHRYKTIGDGWSIPVIKFIFQGLKNI